MLKKIGCRIQSLSDMMCAYIQQGKKLAEHSSKMPQPGASCHGKGSAKQPDSNEAKVHSFFRYLNIQTLAVC